MTTTPLREATLADVPALVALMAEFYAEAGYPLPVSAATRTFEALLADGRLGRAWIMEADGAPAGYVVLTVSYSMEYGGLRGFVDDLFVRASARGRGLASRALEELRHTASAMGVRALLVETGHDNDTAKHVYAKAGFTDSGRLLLSCELASPTHEG